MALLSTTLLVAALAALTASVVAAIALSAVRAGRGVRLALNDGPATDTSAPQAPAWSSILHWGSMVALALLILALTARTVASGHAPWSNLHEFSAAFAAAALGVYAGLERRFPIRSLAPVVAIVAAALIAFSLSLDDRLDPLVPALQQPLLLTIHVGSAVLAYAMGAVAFAAAVGEIVQVRAADRIAALPSAATCRAVAHRAVLLAFPVLTLAIALGALWANLAWRAYWSNDPKELAAAATWLVYGGYLHVALRRDRWASTAPWLLIAGFAGVLFTFIGAGLIFVGEHSYAVP